MKGSSQFKQTIQDYLVRRAESDELFAANYLKADKNIDDCITYVINEVHKSGCNGFPDEEIFSMAVHYYDEENVEVGKPINCQIVVNHTVELTEEEKNQVRKDAIKRAEEEAYAKMVKPKKTASKSNECSTQLTLF